MSVIRTLTIALALFEATFPTDPRIPTLREALEGRPRPAARRR